VSQITRSKFGSEIRGKTMLKVGPPMPDSFRPGNWIGVARSWWKQSKLVDKTIPVTEQRTIRQALIKHIPVKKTVEGVTYTIEIE